MLLDSIIASVDADEHIEATPYHGGLLADPAVVERIWLEEFESARC